jgi:hypothetical protein
MPMSPERRARLATIVLIAICGMLAIAVFSSFVFESGEAHQ